MEERKKGGMDDGVGEWRRRRRRFPFQAFEDTRCFRVTDFLFDSSCSPEQDQAHEGVGGWLGGGGRTLLLMRGKEGRGGQEEAKKRPTFTCVLCLVLPLTAPVQPRVSPDGTRTGDPADESLVLSESVPVNMSREYSQNKSLFISSQKRRRKLQKRSYLIVSRGR